MGFRLPRRVKKKLFKKIYLYPPSEDGSALMAFPGRNQEDYDAYKKGVLVQSFLITKSEAKKRREEWRVVCQ